MRALFTIASLLVVLAIVGVLVKKQMTAVAPAAAPEAGASAAPAAANPRARVQDFQKNLEGAMQQARPAPDDTQ